jgi:hypothetical protein
MIADLIGKNKQKKHAIVMTMPARYAAPRPVVMTVGRFLCIILFPIENLTATGNKPTN